MVTLLCIVFIIFLFFVRSPYTHACVYERVVLYFRPIMTCACIQYIVYVYNILCTYTSDACSEIVNRFFSLAWWKKKSGREKRYQMCFFLLLLRVVLMMPYINVWLYTVCRYSTGYVYILVRFLRFDRVPYNIILL